MTTKEAFKKLMGSPDKLLILKLNPNTQRTFKKRLKDGKLISIEKMEKMLIKAGYKKTPENWYEKLSNDVCPKCGQDDIIVTIYCNKCNEAM